MAFDLARLWAGEGDPAALLSLTKDTLRGLGDVGEATVEVYGTIENLTRLATMDKILTCAADLRGAIKGRHPPLGDEARGRHLELPPNRRGQLVSGLLGETGGEQLGSLPRQFGLELLGVAPIGSRVGLEAAPQGGHPMSLRFGQARELQHLAGRRPGEPPAWQPNTELPHLLRGQQQSDHLPVSALAGPGPLLFGPPLEGAAQSLVWNFSR